MNFKQFLQEKAMNPSTFAKTLERLSSDAKLGFELEMWIGEDSYLYELDHTDRNSVKISDLESLSDWNELFNFYRSDYKLIENKFDGWVDEGDNDGEWNTFFEDQYGDPENFVRAFQLVPTYGWHEEGETVFTDHSSSDTEEKFKSIAEYTAEKFSDYMGIDIDVGGSSISRWRIVEDTSIDGDDAGVGIEIVSPPLAIEDGLDDLRNSFKFMEKNGVETNSSTGLHLNISIPDIRSKLDPLKLILFLGEGHVLQSYDRKVNAYAKEHGADIIAAITKTGKIPNSAKELKQIASEALGDAKYKTVNLGKLEHGYLEFRMAGNTDYHKKFGKVATDIGRFLTVLELACDPEAEQREYAKKLVKLFDLGKTQQRGDLSVDQGLESLVRAHAGGAVWDRFEAAAKNDPDEAKTAASPVYSVMYWVGEILSKNDIQISAKTVAEFKTMLNKILKHSPDALQKAKAIADSEEETKYLKAFMKTFNIK